MLRNLLLFIPLAGLFFLMWRRWGNFDPVFYLLIGLFVGGVILGLVWDRRRLKSVRCPRCGLTISEPTIMERIEGDPIDYHCPACNILWETGLGERWNDGGFQMCIGRSLTKQASVAKGFIEFLYFIQHTVA